MSILMKGFNGKSRDTKPGQVHELTIVTTYNKASQIFGGTSHHHQNQNKFAPV